MTLSLREIYDDTKNTYHMELLEGEAGLSRIMKWVYITEDYTTNKFLQGGELVITTGMNSSSPDWLYGFVDTMIQSGTCGLILNMGKYIRPADITPAIRQLCAHHDYPLFTMPWSIRISDITRDYYNRIFLDTHADHTLTDIFISYIRTVPARKAMPNKTAVLEDYGFPKKGSYFLCVFQCTQPRSDDQLKRRFVLQVEHRIKKLRLPYHLFEYKRQYILVCLYHPDRDNLDLPSYIPTLLEQLRRVCPKLTYRAGIGSLAGSIDELGTSYYRAIGALAMAGHRDIDCCHFDDMGFFKLLLSIPDRTLLYSYVQELIGPLVKYDASHKSAYTETLRQYLLLNGNIQAMAAALFCHRNTVTYRIDMIRTTFGYTLSNTDLRFSLMTAFLVQDYLTCTSLTEKLHTNSSTAPI